MILASEILPIDEGLSTGQSYTADVLDQYAALNAGGRDEAGPFGDADATLEAATRPFTKSRKRKAPTLRAEAWEPYKARIIELHVTQGRPLPEVIRKIKEEHGFAAELVVAYRDTKGHVESKFSLTF